MTPYTKAPPASALQPQPGAGPPEEDRPREGALTARGTDTDRRGHTPRQEGGQDGEMRPHGRRGQQDPRWLTLGAVGQTGPGDRLQERTNTGHKPSPSCWVSHQVRTRVASSGLRLHPQGSPGGEEELCVGSTWEGDGSWGRTPLTKTPVPGGGGVLRPTRSVLTKPPHKVPRVLYRPSALPGCFPKSQQLPPPRPKLLPPVGRCSLRVPPGPVLLPGTCPHICMAQMG